MSKPLFLLASITVLFAAAVPAIAHHSFAAEFDASKPANLKGTVTKVEWQNPHAWFYMDVKDDSGKVSNWGVELGSPNGLMRAGWNKRFPEDRRRHYCRRQPCQRWKQSRQCAIRDIGQHR